MPCLLAALLLLPPVQIAFYDAASDKQPQQSPWIWGFVGAGGTLTGPNGTQKVTLDTTASNLVQQGWLNASRNPLFPTFGTAVTFDLRVVTESHSSFDRAGVSVIVLCADRRGVELSLWEDRVWVQNDNPLFTHGEEALLDTRLTGTGRGGLRRYRLAFNGASYALTVDGVQVLSGPRRDYTAFVGNPNPYVVPDVFWVGDDTQSAKARFEFSYFAAGTGGFSVGMTGER